MRVVVATRQKNIGASATVRATSSPSNHANNSTSIMLRAHQFYSTPSRSGNEEYLDHRGSRRPSNCKTKVCETWAAGTKSNFDMVIAKAKEEVENIKLRIRQNDHRAITTQVFFMDICIAELLLQESNDISDMSKFDRSSWKARIIVI